MKPETPLFSIRDLRMTYLMGEIKIEALKGLHLDFYPKEFVVLLGPSGSGKSTLLNILGGIDSLTSGEPKSLLI